MSTPPRRTRQPVVDTTGPVRCYYADDPALRPHCTLTAAVRYGRLPLCRSCQARRSTVGKGQAPVPVASPELDVLDWISQAQQQAAAAERTLAAAVTRARQAGHPWSNIGTRLGVTRQAAQHRFGRPTDPARQPTRHAGNPT